MAEVREPGSDDADVMPIRTSIGIPVEELLQEEIPPSQWIVPNFVQEANIAILAGPPGAGKTLLAFDWCSQCVAAGRRVFLAQNEGGKRALQDRLRRATTAAGLSPVPPTFTYRRNLQLSLQDMQSVVEFANELVFYELILLDSLASFWPGLNENDPEQMGMVAEALKIICETTGAAVIGIHHTTKAAWKPGEKPSLADIRGHGTLGGRIDAAFICRPLDRVPGVVRFELHTVKQRDEDFRPANAVEILMTGPSAIVTTSDLEAEPRVLSKAAARVQDMKAKVLAVAGESPETATSGNIIVERIGSHKPTIIAAVKELLFEGPLKQLGNGRIYRVKAEKPSDRGRYSRYSRNGGPSGPESDGAD